MTQVQLGQLVGAHKDTIARWERGEVEPRPTAFAPMARALRTSVEWLREGGSETPPRVIQAEGIDLGLQMGGSPAKVRETGAAYDTATAPVLHRLRALVTQLAGVLAELEAREGATPDRAPSEGEIQRARQVMEWVEAQKGSQPTSPGAGAPRRRAQG